jgi:hypothetical protein
MLHFTKIQITQPSPSAINVAWWMMSSSENFSAYEISIYRSELPSVILSDYMLVVSGINAASTNYYNDTYIAGLTNKFATYNYMLEVKHVSTAATGYSKPSAIGVAKDKYANYIINARELVLNKHSGQDYKTLKRKTFGQFCPDCYDETLQRSTKSKCSTCYDTTYVGGFYSPFTFRAQMNEAPPRHILTTFGDWQDQDSILVTSNKIILVPGDVVIDRLFRRWNVVAVRSTNKSMFLISQQVQMRQLEIDKIEYSFPVSW